MAGNRASYYRQRAEEERAASETATTIEARRVHLDMAHLYETKAREADSRNSQDAGDAVESNLMPDGASGLN